MLTYILSHRWHCLAVSDVRAVWVCLCRDRLELEANSLPQSGHFFLVDLASVFSFAKHLIFSSGIIRSELSDKAGDDGEYVDEHSDAEGDKAGEDDLEEKLKSKG